MVLLLVACHAVPFGLPQVWTWRYIPLGAPLRVIFPLVPFAALVLVVWKLLPGLLTATPTSQSEWRALLSLWAATSALSCGVALMHPSGWMQLASLIINPASNSYFSTAITHPNLVGLLDHYEQKMGGFVSHAQTQSAGPIVLSGALHKTLGALPGTQDVADTLFALSPGVNSEFIAHNAAQWWQVPVSAKDVSLALLIAFIFIVIGSLAVVPIYFLGKWLCDSTVGAYAAVGFALLPGFHCFTPSVDQMYPLITGVALCLVVIAARSPQRAWVWMGIVGVWLAGAIFMNLGLATLVPLCIVLWLFCGSRSTVPLDLRQKIIPPLILIVAVPLSLLLLWVVFHFNVLAVYRTSDILRNQLYYNNRSYLWSLPGNLGDFFSFCGVPVTLLFCSHLWHTLRSGKQGDNVANSHLGAKPLLWSFLVVLLLLDLSGKTRGEVARMWLFMTPCVLIPAAAEAQQLLRTTHVQAQRRVLALGGCQFLQVVVFQYFVRVWGY
ncbi:MAG: hypothetical protein JO316_23880 [Abitibacteriaceae bacterium]|nr:hypothetical protein [Abditibacteriaceae bacterium]